MYFTNQGDVYWIVVFFTIGFVMASLVVCVLYLSSRLKRAEKKYSQFFLKFVLSVASAMSLGVLLAVATVLGAIYKQGISLPISSSIALAMGFISQIAIHYFFAKEEFENGL